MHVVFKLYIIYFKEERSFSLIFLGRGKCVIAAARDQKLLCCYHKLKRNAYYYASIPHFICNKVSHAYE